MKNIDYYAIVKDIYMNNPKGFHMILKSKQNIDLLNWINSQTPLLQDAIYTISTKCYWIFNDIHDFPTCEQCGKKFGIGRNIDRRGYLTRFCSKKCANNNEITTAPPTVHIPFRTVGRTPGLPALPSFPGQGSWRLTG